MLHISLICIVYCLFSSVHPVPATPPVPRVEVDRRERSHNQDGPSRCEPDVCVAKETDHDVNGVLNDDGTDENYSVNGVLNDNGADEICSK